MHARKNNPVLGIMWFVVHCFMFAIISIITKLLMASGLHVFEIVFMQTAIGTLLLMPWILIKHKKAMRAPAYKIQIARALLWSCATILFFYATKIIPIGRAIAITFTVPLFTSVLAVIFLKEKLHNRLIVALILGFIGMLIIIKPGGSFEPASLLVIMAALMWSSTDIMIKMVGKTHNASVNTLYFTIFGTICTLPLALLVWNSPNPAQIFLLVVLALFFVANMVSITLAYEYADLTVMMPFVFSELIFVAALAYFIFGEVVSVSTAIGSAVIILSTSYIAYRERKAYKLLLNNNYGSRP